jgi:hypothetical protein
MALLIPAAGMAGGGEEGFDGVVDSIASTYHVEATRIPFLGLASLISRKATRGGVSGLHVAEFASFTGPVDGEELDRMVAGKLGSGWERMMRETSRKGNEQTLIFVHPEGGRMGLFIVDKSNKGMDVVEVSVDPDHLNESLRLNEHRREADGDRDHPPD